MTKKELAVLGTIPEVIRVLEKFNAEQAKMKALMSGAISPQTQAINGPFAAPLVAAPGIEKLHANPMSALQESRKAWLAANRGRKDELLAQFNQPEPEENVDA